MIDGKTDVKKEWTLKAKGDMRISFKNVPQTCSVFSVSVTLGSSGEDLKRGIS